MDQIDEGILILRWALSKLDRRLCLSEVSATLMRSPKTLNSVRLAMVGALDRASASLYERICGAHPRVHFWHWQWVAVRDLHRDLRIELASATGRVLDVGCGTKPYLQWFKNILPGAIVGIDLIGGPAVDLVVEENRSWPFPDASFDLVLCTQVLEHVAEPALMLAEIHRVMVPGGRLVITVPFLYGEHGAPRDYRRFSQYELHRVFGESYTIEKTKTQGGVGSTVCILLLSWLQASWDRRSPLRMLKIPFLPFWLSLTVLANGLAVLMDWLDRTGSFYNNVMVVALKRPA